MKGRAYKIKGDPWNYNNIVWTSKWSL